MDNKIFFTVEYPGVETKKSDFLNLIPKDKICLYFLRYGYFDISEPRESIEITDYPTAPKVDKSIFKGDEKKYIPLAENQLRIVTPKGVPLLENFSLQRTFLNKGYIYLINDNPNAEDAFTEVTIDECGFLEYVVKKGSLNKDYKDLRHPITSLSHRHFLLVDKGSKYWIAYSPIQWSWAYLKEMLNNKKKREERMLWVECKGIYKNEKLPMHLSSFKDVFIHFHKDNGQEHYFSKKLKLICSDERRQDEAGDNYIFEDMFITLHDSIGCACDVSEGVCKKMLEFNACIQALQSGETFEAAFKRLSNGIFDIPKATTKEETEYRQLFSLALTCYQLVYNDPKAILKYDGGSVGWNSNDRHWNDPRPETRKVYNRELRQEEEIPITSCIGNGIDGKKLEGILGIKEREELRETLLSYRKDFGKFLTEEKFLRKHLDDIIENHWSNILIGKDAMTDIAHCMSFNPYEVERPLLLKNDYVANDEWEDWFYNHFKKQKTENQTENQVDDNLKILLNKTIEIGDSIDINKETIALTKVLRKYLVYYEKLFNKDYVLDKNKVFSPIKEKMRFTVAHLNTQINTHHCEMFRIEDDQIRINLKQLGVEFDPNYVKMGPYTGSKDTVMHILRECSPEGFSYNERRPGQVSYTNAEVYFKVRKDVSQNVNPQAAKVRLFMEKVINSKAFNSFFLFLEIYNLGYAGVEIYKKVSYEKGFKTMSAIVKTTDAYMTLRKNFIDITIEKNKKFVNYTKALNSLSNVVSAGWALYDSCESFRKRDLYSSALMLGATASYCISAMAAIGLVFSSTGPAGWIALFTGVGFTFLASLVRDSELETYFKNFLLSDNNDFHKLENQSPMNYSYFVLKYRKQLVTGEDFQKTMMNPLDAFATLFDLIICREIKFSPIDPKLEIMLPMNHNSPARRNLKATSFRAEMQFADFFNDPNNVEVQAFYYPDSRSNDFTPIQEVSIIKTKNLEGEEILRVIFNVPADKINTINIFSVIVFAVRLRIENAKEVYFPYPATGKKERYLGAKIIVEDDQYTPAIVQLDQTEKVRVDTLKNLKDLNQWK